MQSGEESVDVAVQRYTRKYLTERALVDKANREESMHVAVQHTGKYLIKRALIGDVKWKRISGCHSTATYR